MARRFVLLGLASFPLLALACFSSKSPPSPVAGPDAEVADSPAGATVDATLEASAVDAPGEARPVDAPVEAPEPEASVDSAVVDAAADVPVDAPPPPVTVTVVDGYGVPEPGMMVVFDDAEGNYLSTATTNALGQVVQSVTPGIQVTALLGSLATAVDLLTWMGVEPGDSLTAVDLSSYSTPQLQVPGSALPTPLPDGGAYFQVFAGTNNSGGYPTTGTASLDLTPSCAPTGVFPLLVTVSDDTDENVLGFTFSTGNPVALDGGAQSFVLNGSWAAPASAQITAINGTSRTTAVLSEVSEGTPLSSYTTLQAAPDGGAGLVATLGTHPGYGDFVQTEVNQSQLGGSCLVTGQALAARAATFTGSASFDLSQFPAPVSVGLSSSGSGAAIVSLSGTLSGGTYVDVPFNGVLDGAQQGGSWTFVVPPGTTSFSPPTLPPAAADWSPSGGLASGAHPSVATIDGPTLTYATVRAFAGGFGASLVAVQGVAVVPPLPVAGSVRVSVAYTGGC